MFDEHEPAEFKLTPDLAAVERQLARMTPAAPRIDRDRLMFEAGKASQPERPAYIAEPSRLGVRFWPAATAAMTAATVLLSTMLVWQRQELRIALQDKTPPIAATRIAAQPKNAPPASAPRPEMTLTGWTSFRPSKNGYLGARDIALTQGIGALDARFPTNGDDRNSPADVQRTQRDMLNELLPPTHRDTNPRS